MATCYERGRPPEREGLIREILKTALWSVHDRMRERRADLFVNLLQPKPDYRILDLGSATGTFARKIAARIPCQFTLADVTDHVAAVEHHGFEFVRLDPAADRLPFDDAAFDIVLCNSVIEHVTLPEAECRRTDHDEVVWRERARAAQNRFASEIRRVSRGYFVQTPHRDFPFELHTWLPGVNWLPHNSTQRLVHYTNRYWIKQCNYADWQLLRPADLHGMFPDATLHVERLAGLPKSIIAFKRPGEVWKHSDREVRLA